MTTTIRFTLRLGALALVLMGFHACTLDEGTPLTDDTAGQLNLAECESSAQCGKGRFCGDDGLCVAECASSRDCYFKDPTARDAWMKAKAEGIPFDEADLPDPAYRCSECGGCVPVDQKIDDRCFILGAINCDDDTPCLKHYGSAGICNPDGVCSTKCEEDASCKPLGEGHTCQDLDGRKMCVKWCVNDNSCAYHGWSWTCALPDGVNGEANFYADEPVYGRCIPREGGIDWGTDVDAEQPGHLLAGIYGALLETTYTNCGFPLINCQNTSNIHHMLFRVRQTAEGVELDGKYCYHEMYNFRADKNDPTRDKTTSQDNLAWMEVPSKYLLANIPHHWTMRVESAELGSRYETSRFWEVRGARLVNYQTDPIPNKDNMQNEWDQDRDGKPGMTTIMNGVISGEIYQALRYWEEATPEVVQVAKDGRIKKMKGLINNWSETYVLGSSDPTLEQDVTTNSYADSNRTYIRFMRLSDESTCQDVIALGRSEEGCGSEVNARVISTEDDAQWLCHTPTVDGPDQSVQPEE